MRKLGRILLNSLITEEIPGQRGVEHTPETQSCHKQVVEAIHNSFSFFHRRC